MHHFAAQAGTDGRLIFLAGKTNASNSNFQKICDNLKLEICVARSLFEVVCVREEELLSPIVFFSYLRLMK